jgi:predicted nucleotidyltransferase
VKAARTYGARILPSNLEVALELDKIAEQTEGSSRQERLVQMRFEALELMKLFKGNHPLLIGSVWRGTIRRGSDIDIALYHDAPDKIVSVLEANNLKICKTEWNAVTKQGCTESSFHISIETPTKHRIEVVVRASEEAGRTRRCEIFGDNIRGLNIRELELLLRENPTKQFIPN